MDNRITGTSAITVKRLSNTVVIHEKCGEIIGSLTVTTNGIDVGIAHTICNQFLSESEQERCGAVIDFI